MTQQHLALDLNRLASGAGAKVAAMLAELEGNSLSASEAGTGRSMWTRQFAASGKPGKKVDA